MRTIKFRAWNEEKKTMSPGATLEGLLVLAAGSGKIQKVTWLEWTGLHDKKGFDIYEGDIVTWSDGEYDSPSNPRIAEVRFDPELSFYAFNVNGGHKFGFSNFIYTDTEKHLEVIGNRFEHPELLTNP